MQANVDNKNGIPTRKCQSLSIWKVVVKIFLAMPLSVGINQSSETEGPELQSYGGNSENLPESLPVTPVYVNK